MGTPLTGQSGANTYDSLLKITDNGPVGVTAKVVTDGLGNDSAFKIGSAGIESTGTLSVTGATTLSSTLAVTGVATFTAQPILSSLTASSAVATDASKGLVSVTNTGTGNNVLATSPTLVTPILGTPTSGNLVNCTGYVGTTSLMTAGALSVTSLTSAGAISGATLASSGNVGIKGATIGSFAMNMPNAEYMLWYNSGTSGSQDSGFRGLGGNLLLYGGGVNSGTFSSTGLNNTVIGATTPAAGSFTTLTANGQIESSTLGTGTSGQLKLTRTGVGSRYVTIGGSKEIIFGSSAGANGLIIDDSNNLSGIGSLSATGSITSTGAAINLTPAAGTDALLTVQSAYVVSEQHIGQINVRGSASGGSYASRLRLINDYTGNTGQLDISYVGGSLHFDITGAAASTILSSTGLAVSGTISATGDLSVSKAAGTNRGLWIQTSGSNRWFLYANSDAESGSQAGSNLKLSNYNDSGAYISDVLTITRATGAVALGAAFSVTGAATLSSTLDVTGLLTATSGIRAGSGAGLQTWKLYSANTVSPTAPNRTLTVDIGGTTYYIHAKTTND